MVRKISCECAERHETKVNSNALFKEIKLFFDEQVSQYIFEDIPVKLPFYVGISGIEKIKWHATKWYKCKVCGCLWEFNYPDFPAQGFIRKFDDGKYYPS